MKKKLWKKRLISISVVIALVASILLYTNMSIKAEVNETEVYVTIENIPPRTEITEDMIALHSVPSRGVPENAVLTKEEIVGKWTVAGYGIPKNSFLYEDKIVNQSELPDAGILDLKENEIAVPLLVDLESSLGNSIIPNTRIDLYFRNVMSQDNAQKALYGKIASNIRVVAVKDARAANVFDTEAYASGQQQENKSDAESMAKIYIFAVPAEFGDLVNKAKLLGEVVPIATGKSYTNTEEIELDENDVVKYLQESSFKIDTNDDEELIDELLNEEPTE